MHNDPITPGPHTLIIAPPGSGRTLYARRVHAAMTPRYDTEGATLYIQRVANMPGCALDARQPSAFRAPHHTCSEAAMFGTFVRGYRWTPGEVNLAHGGILFLDELPEFRWPVLERVADAVLRQCTELRDTRGNGVTGPASFQLIAATSPCPCGYHGSSVRECLCSSADVARYMGRLDPIYRVFKRVLRTEELKAALTAMEPTLHVQEG